MEVDMKIYRAFLLVMLFSACAASMRAQELPERTDPSSPPDAAPRLAGIEPDAGTWKTWVIARGDALRLPPPPSRGASRAELQELLTMPRDAAAVEQMRYWDAGAPGMRWMEIAAAEWLASKVSSNRGYRLRALVAVA